MSAAERYELEPDEAAAGSRPETLSLTPDAVEVRRNAGLAAALGAAASALSIAYLARSIGGGGAMDGALALVMGLIGGYWLLTFVDARTPLLVADAHGVRIRLGRSWRGLPWSAVRSVEHSPRRGVLHDGRLVIRAHNEEKLLAELDSVGRRRAALASRLYGAPFALPLGISTRTVGAGDDLSAALDRVCHETGGVIVLGAGEPAAPQAAQASEDSGATSISQASEDDAAPAHEGTGPAHWRDPRPVIAAAIARLASMSPHRSAVETDGAVDDETLDREPTPASSTPSPLRESTAGRRSEVRKDLPVHAAGSNEELVGRELRRSGSVSLVEDTQVWGERVLPIARPGAAVAPLLMDDFEVEPASDPVIGPELLAARTRLGLSVDQLADRTRIRPHVIESIEVDDFAPCGGDFYARGHLRTLARVLGVDVTPMLASYNERYAHAEIDARRVFEAELATGASGSIRSTKGGPNWSLLVAVVMALVLCWSVARLIMDAPPELRGSTPVLNGSGGPGGSAVKLGDPVPVVVSAVSGGARVVVRDGAGTIVFQGNLAVGDVQKIDAAPPVRVFATDGAVTVAVEGETAKPIGEAGEAGQGTYVAR